MMSASHIQTLRTVLREEKGVILPGAPNALAARIIADLGFKAVYLTGAGLTNMHLGLPDLGFMDLSQLADHVMAIRCVIDLPLIVDVDTGFGNAVNVTHTVRILEQAGASAIQIEDQHAPKRCGHFDGKELIPLEEMVGKVRAAVDTRRQDLVVILALMRVPSKDSRRQSSGPVATLRRARTSHLSRLLKASKTSRLYPFA
jgi:2-methylisocitrate lyase-like PEP mutase family enzyme